MPRSVNLDMAALRTLAAAAQLGGFGRAASNVGRSASAVSQQMRKLEEQFGQTLFLPQGRGWTLTAAGELALGYARRLLELNDEAVAAVSGQAIEGVVRFGLPADFAEAWLPAALGRFRRAYPGVRVEAQVDRNRLLLERLDRGELDLVLTLSPARRATAEAVLPVSTAWIGPADGSPVRQPGEPVPLAVYEAPCFFRQAAAEALERAGIAWRIAFVSPSLHGLWAAVEAGLGVTLRTAIALPPGLRVAGAAEGLPTAPELGLAACLDDGGRPLSPAALRLRQIVADTLAARLGDEAAAPAAIASA